jgi:hypothetical protein
MAEMLIVKQMALIMREMSPIGKNQQNVNLKYKFRGIDDIYNELHSLLGKHEIICIPDVKEMIREERKNDRGTAIFTTLLRVAYTFMATDGSFVVATTEGEAMDSGDKGCNKAMSAAHKYALVQAFCIATNEKVDTENEDYEVVSVGPKPYDDFKSVPVAKEPTDILKPPPKSKFNFRKTEEPKSVSFANILPEIKVKYYNVFGKFTKYYDQFVENYHVKDPMDIKGASAQADFLAGVEEFIGTASTIIQSKGAEKFADLSEDTRSDVMKTLDKIIPFV